MEGGDREELTFTTLGASGGTEQHTFVIQVKKSDQEKPEKSFVKITRTYQKVSKYNLRP